MNCPQLLFFWRWLLPHQVWATFECCLFRPANECYTARMHITIYFLKEYNFHLGVKQHWEEHFFTSFASFYNSYLHFDSKRGKNYKKHFWLMNRLHYTCMLVEIYNIWIVLIWYKSNIKNVNIWLGVHKNM